MKREWFKRKQKVIRRALGPPPRFVPSAGNKERKRGGQDYLRPCVGEPYLDEGGGYLIPMIKMLPPRKRWIQRRATKEICKKTLKGHKQTEGVSR